MQFTRQFESMEEASANLASKREKAETEHQEKLAAIRQRGQARSIEFDQAAEQDRLAQLQRNLEIALQQESEFTDRTKQSTRMRKEDQVAGGRRTAPTRGRYCQPGCGNGKAGTDPREGAGQYGPTSI
jgi:hypothetical protein